MATEIEEAGGKAMGIAADISSSSQVVEMVAAAVAQWPKVNILVNNAAVVRDQLLLRMKDEEWDEVIDTDLKGAFLCSRAVLKYMLKERWGRIINISSIAGLMGNSGQANYASAKAGLIGLTKSMATEMASRGITVNAVAPGFIDTDLTRHLPPERQQEILGHIPVGYMGLAEDVAEVVAFLASPQARYITGQVITVDGGLSLL